MSGIISAAKWPGDSLVDKLNLNRTLEHRTKLVKLTVAILTDLATADGRSMPHPLTANVPVDAEAFVVVSRKGGISGRRSPNGGGGHTHMMNRLRISTRVSNEIVIGKLFSKPSLGEMRAICRLEICLRPLIHGGSDARV